MTKKNSPIILYSKPVAEKILDETKQKVANLREQPILAIITSGQDEASKVYVRNKVKACEFCGIKPIVSSPQNLNTESFCKLVNDYNEDRSVNGIIVQLPLPKDIDEKKVIETISPLKDIDGFTKQRPFAPCTPAGIISLLKFYKGENFISGKNAVVFGRSQIVGKPTADLLLENNATVTICHSKTKNIKSYTKKADIVVCAIGKPKFLTADMIKPGATVIDVGINRVDNKLCGDCDFENISKIADITPVPGGIGPMTVASLVSRMPDLKVMQDELIKKNTSHYSKMRNAYLGKNIEYYI